MIDLVGYVVLPREISRRLRVDLSQGSISPPAARCYRYVRSYRGGGGSQIRIGRTQRAQLFLCEQGRVAPAPAQTCRVSRLVPRNQARFPNDSVTTQKC